MRDIGKDMKHAVKAAVLLLAILMTAYGTVGSSYADDNTPKGVTTAIESTARENVRRPDFDNLFFRPRFDDEFFRPIIFFNPFFDDDEEEDFEFDFGFNNERDDDD